METQLRILLYQNLTGRKVAFNPCEPEPFDLVDLCRDVTNATRIYHLRTECVREALAGASLVVADSTALADAVRRVLPHSPVVALPFAAPVTHAGGADQPPISRTPGRGGLGAVGLLNHSGEMELNNLHHLKLLRAIRQPLLIYGQPLAGLEAKTEENFGRFSAACDILLLPSLPGVLNSTTLPLALLGSNTVMVAHSAYGYHDLAGATGFLTLPPETAAWQEALSTLCSQPLKLRTLFERNRAYAQRLNRESFQRLAALADQFNQPPSPLRQDCGCQKRKSAPTQSHPVQPIIEKES